MRHGTTSGLVRVGLGAALIALGVAGGALAQAAGPILAVPVRGVVDPFVADHVRRTIEGASAEGSAAVLLEIDTPGGLDSSMREITRAVLGADLPVVCHVSPPGARAASAGAFILTACPVAAMAPGTNVGAATPVGFAGATQRNKAVNDAAAYLRSLAERTGRDPVLAERFVREALSVSAEQALEAGAIDLIAPTRAALLGAIDGRSVTLGDGRTVELRTAGATVEVRPLGSLVGLLHALVDPTLAFVFFWLGLILVVLELLVPGHVFSGTIGTAMLIVAVLSFGLLPVRLLGVVLLAASVVFFLLELKLPGLGAWSGLGLVTLALGGWFLFDRSGGAGVSPVAIAPVAAVVAAFFGFVVAKLLALRHLPHALGPSAVVGRDGVVVTDLDPDGIVRVAAEEWRAISAAAPIPAGARVTVTSLDGLVLTVERSISEHAQTGGAPPGREESV